MDKKFEKTLNSSSRFTTYTLAIAALVKSVKVLQERGADQKAISFIVNGLDQLVLQMEEGVQTLENKQMVEQFLQNMRENKELP